MTNASVQPLDPQKEARKLMKLLAHVTGKTQKELLVEASVMLYETYQRDPRYASLLAQFEAMEADQTGPDDVPF